MSTVILSEGKSFTSWLLSHLVSFGCLGQSPGLFAFNAHALCSKPSFLTLATVGMLDLIIFVGGWGGGLFCTLQGIDSLPGFYPLDVGGICLVVTNVCRHCQMSPRIVPGHTGDPLVMLLLI